MYLFLQTMKTPNGLTALGILLYTIILAVICPILRRKDKTAAACILCVLPLIAAAAHFWFYGTKTLDMFKHLYIGSLMPLICLLPGKAKGLSLVKSIISAVAGFALCAVFLVNAIDHPMVHRLTRYSYTESFTKMLDILEREYCLYSWKKIDREALLKEYLPRVEEAEKNGDEVEYAAVITEVSYRFYDSHVSTSLSKEISMQTRERLGGNDYGFSMIRTDDGSVIAVLADSYSENNPDGLSISDECNNIYDLGIHNGTRILKWDGQDIEEALRNTECIYPIKQFPVKANEDVYRPMFLAGKGGDSVEVTFVCDDGTEKTAVIDNIGSYSNRLECANAALAGLMYERRNNSSRMLDDKCGYIQITKEHFDSLKDTVAAVRHGYYPELTEFYAKLIEDLKAQGMEYLVIDARSNSGGYDCCAGALASLFTDEKRHLVAFGYEDSEGYHIKDDQYIFPDGRYKDLPVAVLVNDNCVSAGDGLAKYLSDCENVTLMGITASGGVNQNNGGYIYITDNIKLLYPCFLSLSDEGVPLIDTDSTRENRIPLDVTIPMTKETALKIFSFNRLFFSDESDPELAYAVDYIKSR